VVLENETDVPSVGWYQHTGSRVEQDVLAEFHKTMSRAEQTGGDGQGRAFAAAGRTEYGCNAIAGLELDVQLKTSGEAVLAAEFESAHTGIITR
jgi:hypothetical protein